ncbi:MAG: 50S ribosomal protein L29 [Patescibacteria group bacterium]|nr:50S ribosomal protein L29 [Patescibacteria group bacterium]MDD4304616.1 50S ribosomal protein L29 [Patescibacteria group bacterium]MDD4695543.1 50S ribosomal protein L29 [Patescibacteria group bacterium]
MKFVELKKKSIKELNDLLKSKREEFRSLRFSIGSEQEKNVRKLREVKKVVSRILTILNNNFENKSTDNLVTPENLDKEKEINEEKIK